jgi:hypothetical protein
MTDTSISAAAERMRCHRQRRRDGMRSLTIEVREAEIDALISSGFVENTAAVGYSPAAKRE